MGVGPAREELDNGALTPAGRQGGSREAVGRVGDRESLEFLPQQTPVGERIAQHDTDAFGVDAGLQKLAGALGDLPDLRPLPEGAEEVDQGGLGRVRIVDTPRVREQRQGEPVDKFRTRVLTVTVGGIGRAIDDRAAAERPQQGIEEVRRDTGGIRVTVKEDAARGEGALRLGAEAVGGILQQGR